MKNKYFVVYCLNGIKHITSFPAKEFRDQRLIDWVLDHKDSEDWIEILIDGDIA